MRDLLAADVVFRPGERNGNGGDVAHHHEHDGAEGQPVLGGAPGEQISQVLGGLSRVKRKEIYMWWAD